MTKALTEADRSASAHWDAIASRMPDLFPAASTQYYRRCEIALVERCIGPLHGQRVLKLDLWNEAVNTRILHWMRTQGASAFGLDISRVVIDRARNHGNAPDRLHLVQADIRSLPYRDDSLDFVYTMGTIEHVDEYRQAVREVHRVLRVGGKAIIGVPHRWNVFLRPLLVRALDLVGRYPYSPERSFGAREFHGVVEDAGLRVRRRTGILTVPGIIRMADLFLFRRNIPLHKLTPLLLWPFDYLETRWGWPGHFGYMIALVAEKDAS